LQFQPSEIAKIAFVLWLSRSLARRQDRLVTFSEGMLPHLAVLGVFAVLLLAEPDFGTTAVLFTVAFALLFVAGARLRHLALCAAVAAPVGAFLVWHSRYRLDRVLAFLDPWADPRGRGYQAVESLLAFGAGGGFGVGLGASSQKLFFLPAAHNDFILSIIGEELGFAGVATVLVLFAVLVWRGIRAAHAAADAEACFVALGLTFLLAAQVLVNAGMALSLLPTKGMALPFLSYGISSVVSSSLAAGILLSVSGGTGGFLGRPVGGRR
jgi:cell division protein FtsW